MVEVEGSISPSNLVLMSLRWTRAHLLYPCGTGQIIFRCVLASFHGVSARLYPFVKTRQNLLNLNLLNFRFPSKVGFGNDAAGPKVEVVAVSDGRGDSKVASAGGAATTAAAATAAAAAEEEDDDIDIDDI